MQYVFATTLMSECLTANLSGSTLIFFRGECQVGFRAKDHLHIPRVAGSLDSASFQGNWIPYFFEVLQDVPLALAKAYYFDVLSAISQ